jgi:hypothetical protein
VGWLAGPARSQPAAAVLMLVLTATLLASFSRTVATSSSSGRGSSSRAGLHVGTWTKPPARCPSSMVTDGPLLGNGDAGAALGGFGMSQDGKQLQQSYYVGKMDFWTQQNRNGAYFSHVAPGHVSLQFGSPPPPPPAPPPPPCPATLRGFCELAHHIPCASNCENKPGGCAASCGVMGSWPLPTNNTHLLASAVAKACGAEPSCVAFGLYSRFYELYNKSSSALAPVANTAWTLFYRNATCTSPGAHPACSIPPPPTPKFLPPDVFSASQELLQARVNASMSSSKGPECGTVTSTAIMAPHDNVLLAHITTTKDCELKLSLNSPNMYGLPISMGSTEAALTMARQNNKWQQFRLGFGVFAARPPLEGHIWGCLKKSTYSRYRWPCHSKYRSRHSVDRSGSGGSVCGTCGGGVVEGPNRPLEASREASSE